MTKSSENRTLKVHPNLIYDVISMQAGTLSKAVTELLQNCYDSEATSCEIVLSNHSVVVADNGNGFSSREEVEECFEVVGGRQPQLETAERTKWGRFRIGRCQMFGIYILNYLRGARWIT